MKKIAVAAGYLKHNYGTALQAYATQMALDKLGYDNEIIDMSGFNDELRRRKTKYFIKASLTSDFFFQKFGTLKNELQKKIRGNDGYTVKARCRDGQFETFIRDDLRLSRPYRSLRELSGECPERYGTVLVGSDQLWLPANIAADYYTLSFVPPSINTVSYATSFGQSSLPKATQGKAAVFLKDIRHVSVREQSGQKLVQGIAGRRVPVVCDPTLLFTGEEWMKVQGTEPVVPGDYIFCYFLSSHPLKRGFARHLKEQTGCKIVSLLHLHEYVKEDEGYADEAPYDISPGDFINLVRNAQYVCTDSFHGSVFSMLYRRKFFAFRRHSDGTKMSTNGRIESILNILRLRNRLITGNEDVVECLGRQIDYDSVHRNIASFRDYSYKYLKASLEDRGSTDL